MTDNGSWRWAVFARVSSEEQAFDKDSLKNQVNESRVYAERLGGRETAGPFIAAGFSLTGYSDLSKARKDIPELDKAIAAAEYNEIDVLLVRYFDRLGDVGGNVFIHFKQFKKQLRSVQESSQIFPPELYQPEKDGTTAALIHIGGIHQDQRINRIISNLKENMPKRVRDGLPVGHVVYGYKYINSRTPPELVPEKAAKVIHARDMLMAGKSYYKIADYLGVTRNTAKYILANPFYAGIINYGMTSIRQEGDVKNRRIYHSKSKWTTGQGKHEPIFTIDEHKSILAEMQRRIETTKNATIRHVFSGLLRCDLCNSPLRQASQGWDRKHRARMMVCRQGGNTHVAYKLDAFMELVIAKIRYGLEGHDEGDAIETEDKSDILKRALEDSKKVRRKIQEGFEAGLYTTGEASKKLRERDQAIEQIIQELDRIANTENKQHDSESARQVLADMEDLDKVIELGDTGIINRLLSAWLLEIRVQNGGIIKLVRR